MFFFEVMVQSPCFMNLVELVVEIWLRNRIKGGIRHSRNPEFRRKPCLFAESKEPRWWFQTFFIFIPTWESDPILTSIFFKRVATN